MLFNLWRFIQLCLPYWVVIQLHKRDRSLPANIKTRTGKLLRATMITNKYGILFTQEDYAKNRMEVLRLRQQKINEANQALVNELNELSFSAREAMAEGEL